MKILIIAKNLSIGESILEEIIGIFPEEEKKERGRIWTKLRNGDTIEIRLTSSILRGLRADQIYLPLEMDFEERTRLLPIVGLSPYAKPVVFYSGGKIC